jgi:hypothetical protein
LPVFNYKTRQEVTPQDQYGYDGLLYVDESPDAFEDESTDDECACHPPMPDRFTQVMYELMQMHDAKSHDYADEDQYSNFRRAERFGISPFVGALIRMSDKMRFCRPHRARGHVLKDQQRVADVVISAFAAGETRFAAAVSEQTCLSIFPSADQKIVFYYLFRYLLSLPLGGMESLSI